MKTFLIITLSFFCITISAQQPLEDNFEKAVNACIALSKAAVDNDSAALKQSARELQSSNITNFALLQSADGNESSVNGHLVFDEAFADSLADGKDAYSKADKYNSSKASRGQTANGSILTKTCFAKAGSTARYVFPSRGHQSLAVVAEAGGRVTLKIHVTNSAGLNKRYDDTKSVKKGLPHRRASFDLPNNMLNTVTLSVVNCSPKDISFVVISN